MVENAQSISPGKLVVGIHHSGKDPSKGGRGHSSLKGVADFEIEIADKVIHIRKQRDGAAGDQYAFDLGVIEIGRDEDDEPVTTCFVKDADPNRAKPVKLSPYQKQFMDAMTNVMIASGCRLPTTADFPNRQGVREDALRKEWGARYMKDATSEDKSQKRGNREFNRVALALSGNDLVLEILSTDNSALGPIMSLLGTMPGSVCSPRIIYLDALASSPILWIVFGLVEPSKTLGMVLSNGYANIRTSRSSI